MILSSCGLCTFALSKPFKVANQFLESIKDVHVIHPVYMKVNLIQSSKNVSNV